MIDRIDVFPASQLPIRSTYLPKNTNYVPFHKENLALETSRYNGKCYQREKVKRTDINSFPRFQSLLTIGDALVYLPFCCDSKDGLHSCAFF